MVQNQSVDSAVETLDGAGYKAAAGELKAGAPKLPVGMATTMAMGINGNPRAATSLLGSIAPEMQSREMNGVFKMAGLAAFFQMLPMFTKMLSGITNGVAGAFTSSQSVVTMGTSPGATLSSNYMTGIGANPANMTLRSMDATSGAVGAYGAGAPSISSPAAVAMQRNSLTLVAGMSGPSMSPPGMA